MTKQKIAALYARFSNDEKQKDRSITDQFADLEKAAKRFGLKLDKRHYYSDRGRTGSTLFERPGLMRGLLGASGKHEFEIVLVEKTDRLSRRPADLFWLADRFKFDEVKIYTPSGEVSDLQLTFDSHQNADFIKTLAMRVKRGADGIAREGKIAGDVAYGYDLVFGKPGDRTINKTEAAIIIRIFTEYANGMTPRKIVAGLHRDGVASPTGGAVWNYQGIVGGLSKRGMIHNRLYIGEYVKNQFRNVKNHATGKTIKRKAADDDLIVTPVPHLRIISDELWHAAHKVRQDRAFRKFGASGYVQRAVVPRKPKLLSGLLRCAECNGLMSVMASSRNGQRVSCSSATYRKGCGHTKSYDVNALTALVVDNMHEHLTDPEFLKERAKARALEFARQVEEDTSERHTVQRQLDRINVQIARLVSAIEDSDRPVKEITASIRTKEIERASLQQRLDLLGEESNVTVLHPVVIKAFGQNIETLYRKLKRNPDDEECRLAFGNIVDRVIVHPTPKSAPYEVSLYARLSAVMGGVDLFPAKRTHQEIVAAEGFPRVSVQAGVINRSGLNRNGVILLGRWRAAA